jgi:XXXCH domain-containing protein
LAAGALLGLGIGMAGVANGRADDKDKNPAIEPILKLAETLKKDPAAGKKEAEALAKKLDFEDVMHVFKPRAKGGVGFDKDVDAKKDGIETKLLDMVKPKPAVPLDKDIKAKAADYARMTEVIQAVTEVTQFVPAPKGMNGKGPKDWKQYIEESKKGAKELADAVKSGDPAKVKTAANNLNSACNNCHTDFR